MHEVVEGVVVLLVLALQLEHEALEPGRAELGLREVPHVPEHLLHEGDVEHAVQLQQVQLGGLDIDAIHQLGRHRVQRLLLDQLGAQRLTAHGPPRLLVLLEALLVPFPIDPFVLNE